MYKASTLTKKVKKRYTCPNYKPFKMILLINVRKKKKTVTVLKKNIVHQPIKTHENFY